MKKIGDYTVRGQSTNKTTKRIILFDGEFDTAYKITKFVIVIQDPDNSTLDSYGVLLTNDPNDPTNVIWNFNNNTQIGWSSMNAAGSAVGPQAQPFELVDRENLVVEDLYVYVETNATGSNKVNYYIEMEKYDVSEDLGVLSMVRNRSQA